MASTAHVHTRDVSPCCTMDVLRPWGLVPGGSQLEEGGGIDTVLLLLARCRLSSHITPCGGIFKIPSASDLPLLCTSPSRCAGRGGLADGRSRAGHCAAAG